MKIINAKWEVDSPDPGSTYKIKGTGPAVGGGTIKFPEKTATVGTDSLEINNVDATVPFDAATVKYFPSFEIKWEISVDGGDFKDAGTSQNPIYVCRRGVVGGFPVPYRTTVHVACASDGATTANQAVLNTWGRLSGPSNLLAWDETTQTWARPLYYYKPGTTFALNPAGFAGALLQSANSSGQCSTWAFLFYDAILLNGATSEYILATSNDPNYKDRFLVNWWVPNFFPGVKDFFFVGFLPDMIPVPAGGIYGDFTNLNTLKGQNSGGFAPSQKVFNNHQFIKYTPTGGGAAVYYDASYGVTYTGELSFQTDAVGGLADDMGGFPRKLDVVESPAVNKMLFQKVPLPY